VIDTTLQEENDMHDERVLARTIAYRYVFAVFGSLAALLAIIFVIGSRDPSGGSAVASVSRGAPAFLLAVAVASISYFFIMLANYTELRFEDDVLIFRGLFGRSSGFRVELLEKVSVGRAIYSFHFRLPKERMVNLNSYLGAARFAAVLEKISEAKSDKSRSFTFEYGKTKREF
jgi:hypothetical protein